MSEAKTGISAVDLGVRDEIAASIDRTLTEEARRNELAIAWVRAIIGFFMCWVEALFAMTTSLQLGPAELPVRMTTVVYFVLGAALVWWLKKGRYHPSVPIAVPLLDVGYVTLRMQGSFTFGDWQTLLEVQELATVGMTATVIALTGAFRMSPRAVGITTALAIAMYTWFGVQLGLPPEQLVVHVALLLALGAMGQGLTTIVHRAVRSEVARMTLGRLLPVRVIDAVHDNPLALLTEPRSMDATIVVTDLRGFTHWAEHRPPIEVLAYLNVVQGALADAVRKNGGTVDKFMGDGMLAVFGAPEPDVDHAMNALAAARDMLAVVADLGKKLDDAVDVGIGIHSGAVVVGCIGSGIRMEFTVLGDTVNTASRLEAMTKELGVPLLISADAAAIARDPSLVTVGEVSIRGREEALQVLTVPG